MCSCKGMDRYILNDWIFEILMRLQLAPHEHQSTLLMDHHDHSISQNHSIKPEQKADCRCLSYLFPLQNIQCERGYCRHHYITRKPFTAEHRPRPNMSRLDGRTRTCIHWIPAVFKRSSIHQVEGCSTERFPVHNLHSRTFLSQQPSVLRAI